MSDEDENSGSVDLDQTEEEALRLKALAEEKYTSGDIKSATKLAKRAHNIDPSLDGLPGMLTAFKILRSSAATPPVLESSSENPNPTPDFYKILQVERFSHLNTIKKQYKALALTLHPDKNPFPASAEAFKLVGEAARVLTDKIRRKEYDMRLRIAMQSEAAEKVGFGAAENFRTACSACQLQHQFDRKYIGHNLVCPNCKISFKAMEFNGDTNIGGNVENSPIRVSARIRERFEKTGSLGILEKCGLGVKRKITSKRVEKLVNEEEEEDTMTLSQMKGLVKEKRQIEVNSTMKEKEKTQSTVKTYSRRVRKDQNPEISDTPSRNDNPETEKEKETDDDKREKRVRRRVSKYGNSEASKIAKPKNHRPDNVEIMPVEDSEFHDFDKDRKARGFKKGQVWALYDDADGMPRHYALVDEIVSFNPLEVTVSWLLFEANGDEEITSRRKMGFYVSCGGFKVSRKASIKYLNFFSHVVDCERAAREVYRVYPTKGSVWAMYTNSSADNNRCHDVVICLSSYSDMFGLSVGYLEKVPGFRTVFKRIEIGANGVICLGKSDVKLFSHRIPAVKLSGSGVPKDCWELDPASLSPQLLMET